ncbi:Uu.00g000180.m01.CDS01 [Anthostomella pinea]|uniref:Uu.00g000180.m01.CDS01 n=1 Tax=Anthostomella pinea TaxID=933095 RepID=A0AAI8VJ29_9PEZI|nr:Uu.00g000180.m01.CDS01 [Anthostomella pinea]
MTEEVKSSSPPPAAAAQDPEAVIEVEVDDDIDYDPTYGDENSTGSTSLGSSALRYEFKHGRRYHSYQAGQYSWPNDDTEQGRLDMIHHVFYRLLEDRLYLAPINPDRGLKVLDIGTGTGLWAIEMGDQHPGAVVVGNDLSPIQPDWVPPNVRFIVDDVELDWVEEQDKYDFIHCRYMAGSIKDWPRLVRQIHAHLKPGGWAEFQESVNVLYSEDGSLKPDDPMALMMTHLTVACDKIGRTMDPAPSFRRWAEDAGFARITEDRRKLPIGGWPRDPRLKEVGTLMGFNFIEGVAAFTAVLFCDVLGWSREEVEVFNAEVRKASKNLDVHPIFDFLVVSAQKAE